MNQRYLRDKNIFAQKYFISFSQFKMIMDTITKNYTVYARDKIFMEHINGARQAIFSSIFFLETQLRQKK